MIKDEQIESKNVFKKLTELTPPLFEAGPLVGPILQIVVTLVEDSVGDVAVEAGVAVIAGSRLTIHVGITVANSINAATLTVPIPSQKPSRREGQAMLQFEEILSPLLEVEPDTPDTRGVRAPAPMG